MAKRKAETILLPVFTKETKKNLEARPPFNGKMASVSKEKIKGLEILFKQKFMLPYAKAGKPYEYESRIEEQLNALGIMESHGDDIYIDQRYKENTRVKSVVIDSLFEEWLDTEKLPLALSTLNAYMQRITDEKAGELLKEHSLNMNLTLCIYPFVVTDLGGPIEDKDYVLSEEGAKKIRKCIEGVYGEGNIWIPGAVMPVGEVNVKKEDLLNKAYKYFSGNTEIKLNAKYGIQKNKKENAFFPLCIPFIVKNEFNGSMYTLGQLYGGKSINETKTPTYAVNKVRFLNENEEPQNPDKTVDTGKMSLEEYILSPDTDAEFSISRSGFKETLINELKVKKGQTLLFFCGWGEYQGVVENIQKIEEENETRDMRYFSFDRSRSYVDQFEEYFENNNTASDILCYLDALGSQIDDICGDDLDRMPDDEKENILVFIDYINENFYDTIYRTMMDRYGEILPVFDAAEYYRLEMTAAGMKEDLANIDADLVADAEKLVRKMWDQEHEQVFTFAVSQGINVIQEQVVKAKEASTCAKSDETLYITLTHFCAAMMMCGGTLTVRTVVSKDREELYGIKGGNWDWKPCAKKEMEAAYTRLPNGSYLAPDKNTVFVEITKD